MSAYREIALLLAVALVCGRSADAVTALSEHVHDSQLVPRIAGVHAFTVDSLDTHTSAALPTSTDGSFAWNGDCRNRVTCLNRVDADGYTKASRTFDLVQPASALEVALDSSATISGQVRLIDGSPAVSQNVYVLFNGELQAVAYVQEDGTYTATIDAGTYSLCAGGQYWGTAIQCFDHAAYPSEAAKITPITITSGQSVTNIDFDLGNGGSISGTLSDAYGPIGDEPVEFIFFAPDNHILEQVDTTTDSQGRYHVAGIGPGTYKLLMFANDFTDGAQLYPGIACPGNCDPSPGADVVVKDGADTGSLDFTVHSQKVLLGRFVDSVSGAPVADVQMDAFYYWYSPFGPDAVYVGHSQPSDGDGRFLIRLNDTNDGASYWVSTTGGAPYIGIPVPDQPCNPEPDCPAHGTSILIHTGEMHFDFPLDLGGALSGSVHNLMTGAPLEYVSVLLYDANGQFVWNLNSRADGSYSSPGLVPGTYYAVARVGYDCAIYLDRGCPIAPFIPNVGNATQISVARGKIRSDVDFRVNIEYLFRDGFD